MQITWFFILNFLYCYLIKPLYILHKKIAKLKKEKEKNILTLKNLKNEIGKKQLNIILSKFE